MNDTQQSPPPAGPDAQFDPHRLRSISDMTRSSDDRVVAGVCAGAARYLRIDPIIVRVVIAVLTLAGLAGAILYLAAWLLLPTDDEPRSIAATWFRLDRNEEQVRVAGLVGAVILAALAIVGDGGAWWGGAPWWILPFALLAYVFWIRPRRRREERERDEQRPGMATSRDEVAAETLLIARQETTRKTREPRSPALLVLTASFAAIALAITWIYDETQDDVDRTTYLAVALGVVAVGLLIGTFFGNGGALIGIGIVLAVALAIGSVFPDGPIGSRTPTPDVAAEVRSSYQHGIGRLDLDLSQVSDPDRLPGRTISIDAGIGRTRVIVPAGLNVDVSAEVDAGQISLFGRDDDGTDISMADPPDQPTQPALTIDIDQRVGRIEVISR